ncbi:MAG: hypothetical protein SO401_07155 [Blautia sp.]|nr:hypothetical protein [Blautia sp.]
MEIKNNYGAIMVEASLYFPITIALVMALLYLGLFKMQESYFFFQVERATSQLAKEIAYPGYDSFQTDDLLKNSRVDFPWEEGPSEEQVQSYYSAYNGSVSGIYRIGLGDEIKTRTEKYQEALCRYSEVFSMGTTEAYIKVKNGFLSKSVSAEIWYEIPTPGILQYLGVKNKLTLYAGAYQPVINTTDFVREVDLAWDMGDFLLEKLGLKGKADEFAKKFEKVKEILF